MFYSQFPYTYKYKKEHQLYMYNVSHLACKTLREDCMCVLYTNEARHTRTHAYTQLHTYAHIEIDNECLRRTLIKSNHRLNSNTAAAHILLSFDIRSGAKYKINCV